MSIEPNRTSIIRLISIGFDKSNTVDITKTYSHSNQYSFEHNRTLLGFSLGLVRFITPGIKALMTQVQMCEPSFTNYVLPTNCSPVSLNTFKPGRQEVSSNTVKEVGNL